MGTSNSSNDEWIELKNISSGIVNLSNWQLLDQGEQIKIVFPNTTRLGAGQFLLLERTNDETIPNISSDIIYVGSLANQNEGLRLFDNNCQLQDEVFAQPDWPAGDNLEKRTLERKSGFSWQTSALINGTPKQENSNGYIVVNSGGSSDVSNTTTTVTTPTTTQTTTTTIKPSYPKILITEIKVAGLSSDGKTNVYDEFIELYNLNNFEIDLTGWYLQKKTSQSNEFSSLVPSDLFEGKIINSSEYFLISHSSSSYQDVADILDSNYSVTDNNTIVL
ncbi:lamin tail domain-containing protein, partial [Candidatus Wolfebacteria bacterium]|nr:lamin tail domain-containing protein [Candidatus Wolfebacteria bacterium]